jgi:hypothetical protein
MTTAADEHLALLHRLLDDQVSLERAWMEINDPRRRPTSHVTIEAIWWCVRERGLEALAERANQARLRFCDATARAELARRIEKLRSRTAEAAA